MTPQTPETERRKHPRYDMYLPVHFHIKDSAEDSSPESLKYFQGFTKNFSVGGLLIEALNLSQPQLRAVGSLEAFVEGSIHIPTYPRPVKFQARPAWSKKEDNNIELIGLYFSSIRKDDLNALLDYALAVNKKTRMTNILMTAAVIALIILGAATLYIYFNRIIRTQMSNIERLQKDQKDLSEKIRLLYQK